MRSIWRIKCAADSSGRAYIDMLLRMAYDKCAPLEAVAQAPTKKMYGKTRAYELVCQQKHNRQNIPNQSSSSLVPIVRRISPALTSCSARPQPTHKRQFDRSHFLIGPNGWLKTIRARGSSSQQRNRAASIKSTQSERAFVQIDFPTPARRHADVNVKHLSGR